MADSYTMKIPKKIHEIYEQYVASHKTIHTTGLQMIQNLIYSKAEDLLDILIREKAQEELAAASSSEQELEKKGYTKFIFDNKSNQPKK